MRTIQSIAGFLSLFFLFSGIKVQAQSPTAPALEFNVFTESDATVRNSHAEGPAAIGGDLIMDGNGWGVTNQTAGSFQVGGITVGLVVGGKFIWQGGNQFSVNHDAYVKIGDGTGTKVWYLNGNNQPGDPMRLTKSTGSFSSNPVMLLTKSAAYWGVSASVNPVIESGVIDFTTAFNNLRANSTALAALPSNINLTFSSGANGVLALNSGINVLNITGTALNNVNEITCTTTPDANHVLVVNVSTGSSFTWNAKNFNPFGDTDPACSYVIWNFPDITGTLTIGQNSSVIKGSVFVPYGDVVKNNGSNLAGQLICKNFQHGQNGSGEFHSFPFLPTISTASPTVPSFSMNNNTQCLSGNSFVFTNSSTGTSLSYNWDFGDGTSSTDTNPIKVYTSGGTYTVTLTANGTGGSNTTTQTVTVNTAPSVSTSPANATATAGNAVSFTAAATGTPAPTVKWQVKNGATWNDISGATTTTYTFTPTAGDNNNQYRAVFTNTCGTANSNTATLTVNEAPAISTQPGDETVCSGTAVSFTAAATGTPTPTVKWQVKNGATWNDISGATTTTYTFTPTAADNNKQYRAVFTNTAGTSNSNASTLTVNTAPSVNSQPVNASMCAGGTASFTAAASGTPAPTVKWQVNTGTGWNDIPGAIASTYSFTTASGDDGNQYRAVYNNTCGDVNTSAATLTINAPVTPSVSISSNASGSICSGTSVTFTATPVNGGAAPAYQWTKNGNNVGTNSNIYVDGSLNDGDLVSVIMTSNASCITTTTASPATGITASVTPSAAQPGAFTASSANVYMGQTGVTYTVPNIAGITYNWSYSGTGITINGSGNSITLDVAQGATSGALSVTATNTCGTSVARTIFINVLPYMSWTCGAGNGNWNDPLNWDGGFVPYGTISVVIPASAPCQPALPTSYAVYNLTVGTGTSIDIPTSGTLQVHGDALINGSVCGGYLSLNGSGAQTISGNGTVCNFELNNPSGATINPGDTLHISQTYQPAAGTLTTNGGLVLLSDSLNGTATILAPAGPCFNYISGNVVVQKWIHGGRRAFRFLAHPFSTAIGLNELTDDIDITGQGGSANGFTTTNTNNPSAFWYNTLTGNGSSVNDSTGWIPYTHTDGVGANAWNPMQGARIYIRGQKGQGIGCDPCVPASVTYDMTGPINMCDVTVNLQTNANAGYNFIGNPYPANIDMSMLTLGSAVGANFSVWDPNQGVYGAYVTQPFQFSYILPAYSSFITTSTSNTNNTITFNEGAKVAAEATGNLFKTTGSSFGVNSLQLRITSNNDSLSWDRLLMFFDGNAVTATEAKDAKKLANVSLDFYSLSSDNDKLAVDFRPLALGDVVPLGLRADSLTTYAMNVEDYEVPAGIQLYLKDKFLNTYQPMEEGMSYSFTVTTNPLSQGEGRFELVAGVPTVLGNLPVADEVELFVAPNPATESVTLSLGGVKGTSVVKMMNLMGQVVYSSKVEGSTSVMINLHDVAQGVYMITVQNGSRIASQKLVKQ